MVLLYVWPFSSIHIMFSIFDMQSMIPARKVQLSQNTEMVSPRSVILQGKHVHCLFTCHGQTRGRPHVSKNNSQIWHLVYHIMEDVYVQYCLVYRKNCLWFTVVKNESVHTTLYSASYIYYNVIIKVYNSITWWIYIFTFVVCCRVGSFTTTIWAKISVNCHFWMFLCSLWMVSFYFSAPTLHI